MSTLSFASKQFIFNQIKAASCFLSLECLTKAGSLVGSLVLLTTGATVSVCATSRRRSLIEGSDVTREVMGLQG